MKPISKALVLTAHPDDLELSCGATVRKIIDQGGSVDNLIIYPYQEHKKYLPDYSSTEDRTLTTATFCFKYF